MSGINCLKLIAFGITYDLCTPYIPNDVKYFLFVWETDIVHSDNENIYLYNLQTIYIWMLEISGLVCSVCTDGIPKAIAITDKTYWRLSKEC